jgi:hypothetical protein
MKNSFGMVQKLPKKSGKVQTVSQLIFLTKECGEEESTLRERLHTRTHMLLHILTVQKECF